MKTAMFKLRFLFLLCSAIVFVEGSKEVSTRCGLHEEYAKCMDPCRTCVYLGQCPIILCEPGCQCQTGYYRNSKGECVTASACDRPCRRDEEYKECSYVRSCCNLGNPWAGKGQCLTGCFCRPPLVRNEDGKCIKPADCPRKGKCGPNEEYSDCVSRCNDCVTKGNCSPPFVCIPGCDCKKRHYRNQDGKCIPEEECDIGNDTCGYNEQVVSCAKPKWCNTCEIRGNCKLPKCVEGCDCKPGYYRNSKGICIEASMCPGTEKCGNHEVYSTCGTACPSTCDNYGHKRDCTDQCVKGCFCKRGYVRNDLQCIKYEDCPKGHGCGPDEQYYGCMPQCGHTCETCDKPSGICSALCRPGCFCKEGLVKRTDGKCVPCKDCPKKCGKDEKYVDCVPCGSTCETYNKKMPCPFCKPGCTCKAKGFVKRKDGRCVRPEDCSGCGPNEEFSTCVIPCNDCEIRGKCQFLVCNEGCDCKKGYYRNKKGRCIPEKQCPKKVECGKDEVWYDHKPDCKNTCENYNNPGVRCAEGEPGCFCKKGLVKRSDGKCVKPKDCDKEICGKGEEYVECVPCGNTCETYEQRLYCKMACRPGCTCKKGWVRRKDGRCVPPEDCPGKSTCGKDEQWYQCIPSCKGTCETYNKNIMCAMICKPGCYCKEGLVKRKDGRCVRPQDCNPGICGPNEEYCDCVNPCNDCHTKGNCQFKMCNKGCDCKKGYYRDENGKCIPESQCPKDPCPQLLCMKGCFLDTKHKPCPKCVCPENCGENEVYLECGSACPATCDNMGKSIACTRQCVRGCFCKNGMVRNKYGACVLPEDCDKRKCKRDEQYYECTPGCKNTCEHYNNPGIRCGCGPPGCFCKEGLVKNKNGKCVPPEQCPGACPQLMCAKGCFLDTKNKPCPKCVCPGNCGHNEEYSTCVNPCNGCDIKGKCQFLVCNKGCDCKKGYYRDENGKCIPESQCPKGCGVNEVHVKCVIPCNDCKLKGKCDIFPCKEGCDCKKGYYRDDYGICIPEYICPQQHTCGFGAEWSKCASLCPRTCKKREGQACADVCVDGCVCTDPDDVFDDYGNCIPEEWCPPKNNHTCGEDKEYQDCGTACPATCENYGKPIICTAQCVSGCFCKKGLVRNSEGRCVIPEKCGKKHCNADEEYTDCGTSCPDTCDNYGIPRPCTYQCVPGCFCKRGTVRNHDFSCVIPEKCGNKKCFEREIYKSCGTACPTTCDNYHIENRPCTKNCVSGCFCDGKYVRDPYTHKCIKPEECPIGGK